MKFNRLLIHDDTEPKPLFPVGRFVTWEDEFEEVKIGDIIEIDHGMWVYDFMVVDRGIGFDGNGVFTGVLRWGVRFYC